MDFTGFYWVLLVFYWAYWVLPGFTGFYWIFNELDWVLPDFTGFYWVLLGFSRALPGFTGLFLGVTRLFAGFCFGKGGGLGFNRLLMAPAGFFTFCVNGRRARHAHSTFGRFPSAPSAFLMTFRHASIAFDAGEIDPPPPTRHQSVVAF